MSDGFAATVTIKFKPGKVQRYLELATKIGDAMSKEDEFKHAWIHTLAGDPDTIIIYEAWSCSYDHFMKDLVNRPYRAEFEAELGEMSVGERKIDILNYALSWPG